VLNVKQDASWGVGAKTAAMCVSAGPPVPVTRKRANATVAQVGLVQIALCLVLAASLASSAGSRFPVTPK